MWFGAGAAPVLYARTAPLVTAPATLRRGLGERFTAFPGAAGNVIEPGPQGILAITRTGVPIMKSVYCCPRMSTVVA